MLKLLMMMVMMINCISINEKRGEINIKSMMMRVKKAIMIMIKVFADGHDLHDNDDDDNDSCMYTDDESDGLSHDDDLKTDWWNTER